VHALSHAPKGNGRAVMLVPGYLADDYSMRPLGAYLGYDVYYTELGRNMGKVNTDMMRLGDRVKSISQALEGQPVTLIGWSLGGVLTREVARLFSDVILK
jgi:pimeloyl-ACP methyl ester carboxylesterase